MVTGASLIDADCIIPAAGLSSRMGDWKLMLPFKQASILEASLCNALAACQRVILVAGYRADELIETVRDYPRVDVVVNTNYRAGMFSSIKLGAALVTREHFFIAHADMPCIHPSVYHKLWQARTQGAVFAGDEQRTGHPVLISSTLKAAISAEAHNASMKGVLNRYERRYLNLADAAIHLDVDTPSAYQQLLSNSSQ
jgi:molybdenum cofactor cytidylyltransferase